MTLRIGQIDYANCTPIFTSLTKLYDCSDYRFVRGVPAELNALLRRGDIDVCPSSSFEYASSPESYLLLPELSISSFGRVKSVLLFSRLPIEELDNQPVGLTTESATSVNLLKILLARAYGFRNDFRPSSQPFPEALTTSPALLLIGDGALKAARRSDGLFVYDLGELWHRFTGLPFVFALWLVTRRVLETRREELQLLRDRLIRAKRHAYDTYGEIASRCAEQGWMASEELVAYWQTISYDLSADHLRGVATFFAYAAEMGLLTSAPEIRLFDAPLPGNPLGRGTVAME